MNDKHIVEFVELFDMLEYAIRLARNGSTNWDTVYNVLFICDFALFPKMQAIHRIDYYDPDSSYEADVLAYYNAAKPVANFYKKLVNGESEGE